MLWHNKHNVIHILTAGFENTQNTALKFEKLDFFLRIPGLIHVKI